MRSLAHLLAIALLSFTATACTSGEDGLAALHTDIVSDHASVAQISPQDFLKLDPETTLILDIREPEEYAVSRLPGAIWVPPGADAKSAIIQAGNVSGKEVVVYCSVGRRSSIFAERVQDEWLQAGAVSVSNLEEGIFGWHNAKRPLVDAEGETDAVHPYDPFWERYVTRQDQAKYTPQ